MCNKKVRLITAIIVASSVLMFSGCGKNASTTEPVISDAVEETEPIEEENDTEEIEESEDTEAEVIDENNSNGEESTTGGGSSVEISGETVGNTTLTQEEIDALKANADENSKIKLEAYETVINGGEYLDQRTGGTVTNAVGTPGDTSWRRMTDAEAQAIIDKGEPNSAEERSAYEAAEAELSAGTWSRIFAGTVYFDYYAYDEAANNILGNNPMPEAVDVYFN